MILLRVLACLWVATVCGCGGLGPGFTAEEQARFDEGARRHEAARQLLAHGVYDRATDEYVSLWIEGTSPSRPKGTYFVGNLTGDITSLVKVSPEARDRFNTLRQPLESYVLSGTADASQEREWLEFIQMIGAEFALVEYVSRFRHDREHMDRVSRPYYDAFNRLIAQGRWDLAGWVYTYPPEAAGDLSQLTLAGGGGAGPILRVVDGLLTRAIEVAGGGQSSGRGGGDITATASPERRRLFEEHNSQLIRRAARIAVACDAAGRSYESRVIRCKLVREVGEDQAREALARAEQEARDAQGIGALTPTTSPAFPAFP